MASQFVQLPLQGGGSAGVSSLNSLTGALTLVAGTGISITPSGSNITIAATGGGSGTVTSFTFTNGGGFAGTVATATTTPTLSLVGTLTGDVTGPLTATALTATTNSTLTTLSALALPASQITSAGNLTDAGTDGITVTGGTGALLSSASISQHVADTSHSGYLSSTDWNTFNGKQAAGSYITALTGDGTASGPGSVALTLATVNSNVGSFGTATQVGSFTVNGKGLITAASNTAIQIAESQVTNLTTDLASKLTATLANGDIFVGNASNVATAVAMSGDATIVASGALTLATVATAGTTGSSTAIPVITINAKGLTTGITTAAVVAPAGTLSGTTLNSTVVSSSLTSVGTITSGTWNGTTVDVSHGGTGDTTLTNNAILIGKGTSAISTITSGVQGTILIGNGATNAPSFNTGAILGYSGVVGNVSISDGSVGPNYVQILTQGTASNYNFNLPANAGSAGQVLTSQGGGSTAMTWTTPFALSGLTTNGVIYATSSSAIASTATGTAGQVLTSNGSGSAPTFQAAGGLPSESGIDGIQSLGSDGTNTFWQTPFNYSSVFDEMYEPSMSTTGANDGPPFSWVSNTTGGGSTGGATAFSVAPVQNRPGIFLLQTGTTSNATGGASISSGAGSGIAAYCGMSDNATTLTFSIKTPAALYSRSPRLCHGVRI